MNLVLLPQKKTNGTYIYDVAFAEWQGKSMGAKVEVQIKGDSIFVYSYQGLSGEKGELIDSGILVKHRKGEWIIAHSPNDRNADEIGGCSDGPSIIDLENEKFWLC